MKNSKVSFKTVLNVSRLAIMEASILLVILCISVTMYEVAIHVRHWHVEMDESLRFNLFVYMVGTFLLFAYCMLNKNQQKALEGLEDFLHQRRMSKLPVLNWSKMPV